MRYRKDYLLSYNVDWFCKFGHKWIHTSSQGGMLPDKVDDSSFLPQLQSFLNIIPIYSKKEDVIVNESLVNQRFKRHMSLLREMSEHSESENIKTNLDLEYEIFRLNYIESFVEMAQKGFYSFVRVNIDNFADNQTLLVAKPTNDASNCLFQDISSILEPVMHERFSESSRSFREYIEGITRQDVILDFNTELLSYL